MFAWIQNFFNEICCLFWSLLNEFSFKNQNRLLNANITAIVLEKKHLKLGIREKMWWARTKSLLSEVNPGKISKKLLGYSEVSLEKGCVVVDEVVVEVVEVKR